MIEIDGSQGEGGGQVLRSCLALSLLTGQQLNIFNIRARRSQPGLRAQHLKSVEAAVEIGKADVDGAHLGSTKLVFRPGSIQSGRYQFKIGTAGATTLVLQTIFLPLCLAKSASTVAITGGTHVPMSPCFHYLDQHWLFFLKRIGLDADIVLKEAGFYPQGGGRIEAVIRPVHQISPLILTQRGRLVQIRGISAVANLDRKIAERQRNQVLSRMGDADRISDLRVTQLNSQYKGTLLLLIGEFEYSQCCYFSLGELGKPAERVADEAIEALLTFLSSDGAIDEYLADQLLLPLSLASGKSQLRTARITNHLLTNALVIREFLPVDINIEGEFGQSGLITIDPDENELTGIRITP